MIYRSILLLKKSFKRFVLGKTKKACFRFPIRLSLSGEQIIYFFIFEIKKKMCAHSEVIAVSCQGVMNNMLSAWSTSEQQFWPVLARPSTGFGLDNNEGDQYIYIITNCK